MTLPERSPQNVEYNDSSTESETDAQEEDYVSENEDHADRKTTGIC